MCTYLGSLPTCHFSLSLVNNNDDKEIDLGEALLAAVYGWTLEWCSFPTNEGLIFHATVLMVLLFFETGQRISGTAHVSQLSVESSRCVFSLGILRFGGKGVFCSHECNMPSRLANAWIENCPIPVRLPCGASEPSQLKLLCLNSFTPCMSWNGEACSNPGTVQCVLFTLLNRWVKGSSQFFCRPTKSPKLLEFGLL